MKILLVNRGACSNLGDQAINLAFRGFLEREFSAEVEFSDYTVKYKNPLPLEVKQNLFIENFLLFLKKILPLRIIWILRNYLRINREIKNVSPDLIVIGGGQLLLPGIFCLAAATWVFSAKRAGKKIIFSNIGLGGRLKFFDKLFVRYCSYKADEFNFRDEDSRYIFSKITKRKDLIDSGDIVFTTYSRKIKNTPKSGVLISIPHLSVYNEYNAFLRRKDYHKIFFNYLLSSNVKLSDLSLIYTTSEDYKETILFRNYIMRLYNIEVELKKIRSLRDLMDELSKCECVISGRMHALILALIEGAEIKAFPISDKIKKFSIDINKNDLDNLRNKTEISTKKVIEKYCLR